MNQCQDDTARNSSLADNAQSIPDPKRPASRINSQYDPVALSSAVSEWSFEASLDQILSENRHRVLEVTCAPDFDTENIHFMFGNVILGRYEVLAEIGFGGMGAVYRCRDLGSGNVVAVKKALASHSVTRQVKDNFKLISRLAHPNIAVCRQLELDEENDDCYLIMEYVDGITLDEWKNGNPTRRQITDIIQQIADALDYAHAKNVLHCDIKPSNVLVDSLGHVKILDFGIAVELNPTDPDFSRRYHRPAGTARYMAPEQWLGEKLSAATDQYALAALTYKLLCGHAPFPGDNFEELKNDVLTKPAPELNGIPEYAKHALERALSKNPEDRYDSCSDFVKAFQNMRLKPKAPAGKGLLYYASLLIIVLIIYWLGMFFRDARADLKKNYVDLPAFAKNLQEAASKEVPPATHASYTTGESADGVRITYEQTVNDASSEVQDHGFSPEDEE